MNNKLKQIILDAHLGNEIVKNKEAFELGLTDKQGKLTAKGDQVARNYAQEKHPEWIRK